MVTASLVRFDAAPPTIEGIVAIARGARVELGDDAVAAIVAGRAVVDGLVHGEGLIYGLNTGLGHMRDQRVPLDTLREYQRLIVRAHDGGLGPALPREAVRAAMAVRLAGIARGGSGASLRVARGLAALLNAGITPVVPATGSVGASDLMHMASIGAVLIGEGRAELGGDVLPGGEALGRAGLVPVVLEPKDGLAVVSANGMSVGLAALVVARAERLAVTADLVLAASLEVTRANPSVLDAAAVAAKPVPGQAASAAQVRAFLVGGDRWEPGAAASVQDPLSFRVGPQVHGAFRETLAFLRAQVEAELAAADDNPVVLPDGRMVSNGNFHPLAMALAADALRPALAHVGQLADRRMNHLWAALFAGAEGIDGMVEAAERAGILLRYAAAARAADLRSVAGPVTLDIGPLDLGVEDHATNAAGAVLATARAMDALEDVLAVELLLADEVARRLPPGARLGAGSRGALVALNAVRSGLPADRSVADLQAAVRAALPTTILAAAMDAAQR